MKHFIVFVIVCLIGKPNSYAQLFKLNANIVDVDTVLVIVRGLNWSDTLFTTNGNINYEKKMYHHEMVRIIFVKNNQSINAIKEGNERKMRSKTDGVFREIFSDDKPVIFSSAFSEIPKLVLEIVDAGNHKQYSQFSRRFDPLIKIARTIIDSSVGKSKTEVGAVYTMLYNRVLTVEQDVAIQFVKEFSNSIVGAYVLYRYCRVENPEQLSKLLQLFDPVLQQTGYLQNIAAKIRSMQALIPGKQVPTFEAKNAQGEMVSIESLRGKYIVLDFWGSWCEPCLKGFPRMKQYQVKWKAKCSFVGIACNDAYPNWKKALDTHTPDWLQLMNSAVDADDVAKKYNVEAFPTKILIDPSGAFVASFVGESEDFYTYIDQLFAKQ